MSNVGEFFNHSTDKSFATILSILHLFTVLFIVQYLTGKKNKPVHRIHTSHTVTVNTPNTTHGFIKLSVLKTIANDIILKILIKYTVDHIDICVINNASKRAYHIIFKCSCGNFPPSKFLKVISTDGYPSQYRRNLYI